VAEWAPSPRGMSGLGQVLGSWTAADKQDQMMPGRDIRAAGGGFEWIVMVSVMVIAVVAELIKLLDKRN